MTRMIKSLLKLLAVVMSGGLVVEQHFLVQVAALTMTTTTSPHSNMWQMLETFPPAQAWTTMFGLSGERGEYMDGYSPAAMLERCRQDYKWTTRDDDDDDDLTLQEERAAMMSHLYDKERLWEHVCMVAFAEHYLTSVREDDDDDEEEEDTLSKPFATFQRYQQQQSQLALPPIFAGVVWNDWQASNNNDIVRQPKLRAFQQQGIDYVRLECNFGSEPNLLANNALFSQLAQAAKKCQENQMVPLLLMQVPWREFGAMEYFEQAVTTLANALQSVGVDSKRLLLETRPPIGVSASEERSFKSTRRIALGWKTGQKMFQSIQQAFAGETIAGFCVAGGSTKGNNPTAMQDDCQNAVRQGMRSLARQEWGYDLCFWEMGAKLMLQPQVGRLWGTNTQAGRDAARELFCLNARDLADEIKVSKVLL